MNAKLCKKCSKPFKPQHHKQLYHHICAYRAMLDRAEHRGTPFYYWKKEVIKHKGKRCVECGSTANICIDHIKPWAVFPELRYQVSNGQPLCKPCHTKKTNWERQEYKELYRRRKGVSKK